MSQGNRLKSGVSDVTDEDAIRGRYEETASVEFKLYTAHHGATVIPSQPISFHPSTAQS